MGVSRGLPHRSNDDMSGDGVLVSLKPNLTPPVGARLLAFMATVILKVLVFKLLQR